MNPDLKKKLLDDLEKSGFGSEMRAARTLLDAGWSTDVSRFYIDRDEDKPREIDITANRLLKESDAFSGSSKTFRVQFFLIAEVKKSNNPWIVFKRRPQRNWELDEGWGNLIRTENLRRGDRPLTREISRLSLTKRLGWRGYSVHESFKSPSQSSRWFSACIGVSKAAEEMWRDEENANEGKVVEGADSFRMSFIKPIIILDGPLVSAELNGDGEVELEMIPAAPLRFRYTTASSKHSGYWIDIVQMESLADYIAETEKRQQGLLDHIADI